MWHVNTHHRIWLHCSHITSHHITPHHISSLHCTLGQACFKSIPQHHLIRPLFFVVVPHHVCAACQFGRPVCRQQNTHGAFARMLMTSRILLMLLTSHVIEHHQISGHPWHPQQAQAHVFVVIVARQGKEAAGTVRQLLVIGACIVLLLLPAWFRNYVMACVIRGMASTCLLHGFQHRYHIDVWCSTDITVTCVVAEDAKDKPWLLRYPSQGKCVVTCMAFLIIGL